MKKIAIVALAAAATFITSCDIERMPYDKYTEDKIMEDKDAAVDVLLNGCYAKLKTASEHLHYCGEFPGDNVCKDKPTTNPFGTYFTYQHTVNNGGLSTVWNSAYNIISQTSSLMNLNSATVSINRLLDSKLSLWCLEALFECCISRDKPFHPLTPPSDLRQYAVENRQEI